MERLPPFQPLARFCLNGSGPDAGKFAREGRFVYARHRFWSDASALSPHFPGTELFDYNRRLIRTLSPGFTTLWVEDHLQLGETATHESMTTLSYFAGEFPQFRVGALVLCQSYRNPALTAKMAANLQLLSGGRFILGLGAGWKEDEYHAYGYSFPDTKTRLEQLEEAAIIVKAMWSSRPATFLGKHYTIRDPYC